MINLIEKTLRPLIAELPFVDRYGGVVRTITQKMDNASLSYPVSHYASEKRCFEDGLFTALVPDSDYKSVSYFEQRGASRLRSSGAKGRETTTLVNVRFVCWLNLQKLGISDVPNLDNYIYAVINKIKGRHEFDVDGFKGAFTINELAVPINDHKALFADYSYSDKQEYFFFPYAYFAIDPTIEVEANLGCLPTMTLGMASECEPSTISNSNFSIVW